MTALIQSKVPLGNLFSFLKIKVWMFPLAHAPTGSYTQKKLGVHTLDKHHSEKFWICTENSVEKQLYLVNFSRPGIQFLRYEIPIRALFHTNSWHL